MVELQRIDMYRIINEDILRVADDMVPLDILEVEDRQVQFRLHEAVFSLAERRERLTPVVTAHNLMQYTNKFYSIGLATSDVCWLDILIDLNQEDIDLSGLGGTYAV